MTAQTRRPALPRIDAAFGAPAGESRPLGPGTLAPLVQAGADDGTDTDVHMEEHDACVASHPVVSLEQPEAGLPLAPLNGGSPLPRKQGKPFAYSMPNMVYAPVELGTVRIGYLEDREGAGPRPVRDDQFRITRLVRKQGHWLEDPLQKKLVDALPPKPNTQERPKLREIPIRLQSDSPDLVCRTRFEAFDTSKGRSVCASVGAGKAKRFNAKGAIDEVDCVGPDACEFAKSSGVRCKLLGRMHFEIEGQSPNVDNTFVFRSTSINTLRNIEAKLARFWALFGGRLRGVPFRLVLRSRTTPGSKWSRFYFVDLELRQRVSLAEAKLFADQEARAMAASGLDYEAWEDVIRAGLANGALVGDESEAQLVREFFAGVCEDELGTNADEEPDGGTESGVPPKTVGGLETLPRSPTQAGAAMGTRKAAAAPPIGELRGQGRGSGSGGPLHR